MGLDLVELVMKIEEDFGITIPDKDAQYLNTPRKLANYIISRISFGGNIFVTQSKFYVLRLILMQKFGVTRKDICPDTRFDQIFQDQPIKQWEQLNEALGHILYLKHRSWFKTVIKPPVHIKTVRDLLPLVQIPLHKWQIVSEYKLVLRRIIDITSEQLSIPLDKIHPDSDFVYELGVD